MSFDFSHRERNYEIYSTKLGPKLADEERDQYMLLNAPINPSFAFEEDTFCPQKQSIASQILANQVY